MRHWILKFAPLAKDLSFKVLVQPHDAIVSCAVQKLVNIINGNFDDTTTLVNVEIADFWTFWKNEIALEGYF